MYMNIGKKKTNNFSKLGAPKGDDLFTFFNVQIIFVNMGIQKVANHSHVTKAFAQVWLWQ